MKPYRSSRRMVGSSCMMRVLVLCLVMGLTKGSYFNYVTNKKIRLTSLVRVYSTSSPPRGTLGPAVGKPYPSTVPCTDCCTIFSIASSAKSSQIHDKIKPLTIF